MKDGVRIDASIIVPFIIFTGVWGSTWIVIRDQIGTVPPQWSVAYRFMIAAVAMALVAKWKGQSLKLDRGGLIAALVLGVTQFSVNFNSVYLAERYITSGVVATVFALLLIPNSLLAWAFLGQKPNRRFLMAGLVAIAGVALLFVHEIRSSTAEPRDIAIGLALTLLGLLGASSANVYQAGREARRHPLLALLAWSMAIGALLDAVLAYTVAGPPVVEGRLGYWAGIFYLALFGSVLCFALYFPVVRKIGPGKAAYSSVMVPIIAMSLSTAFEGYRWSALAVAGGVLALGGMLLALAGRRRPMLVTAPDAA
ncbi:DMT family transporter [Sphingomonas sp. G124]|uniref:DMT family transporter n=1 Tax=Sphingomonas cremea TaxID=2904799 RepID=A0A9X1QPG5_9SPHN|nr:DMT family transporter [Sphingomonas cremea]MCF2515877.1 DMT family transporter [Sphingomonas cremea]